MKSSLDFVGFRGKHNPLVGTEFLDRLASQLKVGKDPASRRAIERILDFLRRATRAVNIKASPKRKEIFGSWSIGRKNSKLWVCELATIWLLIYALI